MRKRGHEQPGVCGIVTAVASIWSNYLLCVLEQISIGHLFAFCSEEYRIYEYTMLRAVQKKTSKRGQEWKRGMLVSHDLKLHPRR